VIAEEQDSSVSRLLYIPQDPSVSESQSHNTQGLHVKAQLCGPYGLTFGSTRPLLHMTGLAVSQPTHSIHAHHGGHLFENP
jgi:hypothetical protein